MKHSRFGAEKTDVEVVELIRDYLDGNMEAQQLAELEQILKICPAARAELRKLATVEECLADRATVSDCMFAGPNDIVAGPSDHESRLSVRQNVLLKWLPWMIATAAGLLLFVKLISPGQDMEPLPEPISVAQRPAVQNEVVNEPETPRTFVAVLVDHVNAKFSKKDLTRNVGFSNGDYELNDGSIHLRFSNGADVVVNSPARFSIQDALSMRLDDGVLRAIVPASAHGFRVASPGIDYKDLGTEFGVFADSSRSLSEMYVFEGQVDTLFSNSDKTSSSFLTGDSVVYRNGLMEPGLVDISQFPRPGTIGLIRWDERRLEMQNSRGIIGYFPFIPTGGNRLLNHANHGFEGKHPNVSHGTIHDASWAGGRWPGKKALLFENDAANVQLEIPGEYEELTFAVWMKVDRFDFSHNVVLNSDGWQDGAIHWQMRRTGGPWLTPFKSRNTRIDKDIPAGVWVHLVATISVKTGKGESYLNGELIGEVELADDTILVPGSCRLGNWNNAGGASELRAFRGRIDELSVWRRRLDPEEISRLVELGRPSILWIGKK